MQSILGVGSKFQVLWKVFGSQFGQNVICGFKLRTLIVQVLFVILSWVEDSKVHVEYKKRLNIIFCFKQRILIWYPFQLKKHEPNYKLGLGHGISIKSFLLHIFQAAKNHQSMYCMATNEGLGIVCVTGYCLRT